MLRTAHSADYQGQCPFMSKVFLWIAGAVLLVGLGIIGLGYSYLEGAFAPIAMLLPSSPSVLGELFGSELHRVECNGCSTGKTFKIVATLPRPHSLSSLVWSPDGKYLAVGSLIEAQVDIYDTSNLQLVSHITAGAAGESNFMNLFTSDSQYLIRPTIGGSNIERVSMQKWDIASGTIAGNFLTETQGSRTVGVAASSTNNLIAGTGGVGISPDILLYNSNDYSVVQNIPCEPRAILGTMAFSNDGHDIAVGGCHDGYISVYNVDTGKIEFEASVARGAELYNFISYSPDDTLIAISSYDRDDHGRVVVLKNSDGSLVGYMPITDALITNLQWLDNDHVIVSYSAIDPDGSVARVWNVASQSLTAVYAARRLQMVSLSPNKSLIAAAIGDEIKISNF